MAGNDTIAAVAGEWTPLNEEDATSITFQVLDGAVTIMATVGGTEPESAAGGLSYGMGQGERAVSPEELFPGVVGAKRLWAHTSYPAIISYSYA